MYYKYFTGHFSAQTTMQTDMASSGFFRKNRRILASTAVITVTILLCAQLYGTKQYRPLPMLKNKKTGKITWDDDLTSSQDNTMKALSQDDVILTSMQDNFLKDLSKDDVILTSSQDTILKDLSKDDVILTSLQDTILKDFSKDDVLFQDTFLNDLSKNDVILTSSQDNILKDLSRDDVFLMSSQDTILKDTVLKDLSRDDVILTSSQETVLKDLSKDDVILTSSQDTVLKDWSKDDPNDALALLDDHNTRKTLETPLLRTSINDTSALSQSSEAVQSQNIDGSCPKKVAVKDIDRDDIPEELYNVAPHVFDNVPSKFLEGFRNPCWKQSRDNTTVCLPSFFLAGVGKCGTSDLWDKINQHPGILRASKEPRWWTRRRLGRDLDSKSNTPVSFQEYLEYYDELAHLVSQNVSEAKTLISGDGSPSVYWDNALWKHSLTRACANSTTPRYVISDVIRTILPQSKIIAVFRDPTDRLYSDYLYQDGSRTRQFIHKSVVRSTRKINSCLVESSRRECVFKYFSRIYAKGLKNMKQDHLGRHPVVKLFKGFYSVFMADWLDAFPRDQLMFIRLEDWHRDCEEILPDIYRFLELSAVSKNQISEFCSRKQKNPTYAKKKRGPILEETRILLNEFYEPTLRELAEQLEDDRFLWADSSLRQPPPL